jgi:hypothetical protein
MRQREMQRVGTTVVDDKQMNDPDHVNGSDQAHHPFSQHIRCIVPCISLTAPKEERCKTNCHCRAIRGKL